jgi:hypothetical protein
VLLRVLGIAIIFNIIGTLLIAKDINLDELLDELRNQEGINLTIDEIDYYINLKLNLNKTTVNKLSTLPTIDKLAAQDVLEAVKKYEDLETALASTALSNIQKNIILLCSYIPKSNNNEIIFQNRLSLSEPKDIINLTENNRAFDNNVKLFGKVESINAKFGFSANKDIGESNLFDTKTMFADYNSEPLQIIVGNFRISSSEGLVFGRTFDVLKGTRNFNNNPIILRGFNSEMVHTAFSGISSNYSYQFEKSSIMVSGIYSNRYLSSTLDSLNNVSSVYRLGYFRDSTELSKKENLHEVLLGGIVNYRYDNISIGLNLLNFNYSNLLKIRTNDFQSKFTNFSIFGAYETDGLRLSSELAFDNDENPAIIGKLNYVLNGNSITGLIRYYSKEYNSIYASSFSEYSRRNNEFGVYLSYEYNTKAINNFTFFDYFRELETINQVVSKRGYELFNQTNIRINKDNLSLNIRMKNLTGGISSNDNLIINESYRTTARLQYEYFANDLLKIRFGTQYTNYSTQAASNNGYEIGLRLNYKIEENLNVIAMASSYSIDDFDAALWSYEQIFPTLGFVALLNGRGERLQIAINYKFLNFVSMWVRYMQNSYLSNTTLPAEKIKSERLNLQLQLSL